MSYPVKSHLNYDLVKIVSVLAYLTVVGWLIAMVVYGNHRSSVARFHLRDSLGLILTGALLMLIPLIGWVLASVLMIVWCIGLIHAIQGRKTELPVIGRFYQEHLDFIR